MSSRFVLLQRVINPQSGGFSDELARHLLALDFPPEDHARYVELSEKAQRGALGAGEHSELEDYIEVNDFLTLVQARARASLRHRDSAA